MGGVDGGVEDDDEEEEEEEEEEEKNRIDNGDMGPFRPRRPEKDRMRFIAIAA